MSLHLSPARILSLDGGGVRGLSSLLILEKIMELIKSSEGLSEVPSPCDRFDLIGGTGTGGIIAVMLGRLKMTVDQSIQAYKSLANIESISEPMNLLTPPAFPTATNLEDAIKKVARENCSDPRSIASYPIKIGRDEEEFIDARYGFNNPCEVLISEAEKQFPGRKIIILSIGTGLGDVVEVSDSENSMFRAFSRIATTSKHTDLRLRQKYSTIGGYYRFNVENGLGDTALPDSHTSGTIAGHTRNYLGENQNVVEQFVNVFTSGIILSLPQPGEQQAVNSEKDNQCLSDLYVTDPRTDKKTIEEKKGGLLDDCYKWILGHTDFQRFRADSECRILWIKGDPGKGKTMLLCGIVNELESDPSVQLSYFFCQATSVNGLNTATSVLRGMIYHLASHNPQLTKYLRAKYDSKGKRMFNNDGTWHDLCEMVTAMLKDPTLKNAILIVDALDECSVERQRLLDFICTPSPAKWIVSSRNWPDIEESLDDAKQKVKIHLEMNHDSVSAAVGSYIQFKADQLAQKKKYDKDMKSAVLEHLQANSNGTFLWVALVCQELSSSKTRKWRTLEKLKSFPPGLDALYSRMLDQIHQSEDSQLYKEILATALVLYRSIALEEFRALIEELEHWEREEVEEAIGLCGSFLAIHDNTVSFVHQSAKDYLLNEPSSEMFPSGILHQHHMVFVRSLDLLRVTLKRDMYGLQAPGCLMNEVSRPDPDPLATVQYSCIFWIDHLCDSSTDAMGDGDDGILEFLEQKYLQWLEALSLLGNLSSGGRALQKLEAYLQGKAHRFLWDIVKDARRFLLSNMGIIEIAPLQIYISALIFSPTSSLIRRQFIEEEPDWIEVKPKVEPSWNGCLQTLEGHKSMVTSVTFSNDGQRLASGSWDKTAKIWDGASGTCLHTLGGHNYGVTSVVFSNDGLRLASGSCDKTVKIWDVTSGICLHTLKGYPLSATPTVPSNYGERLALEPEDNTVKTSDATSSICLHTLGAHYLLVTSVVFSNDGRQVALGSKDTTVRIWDATSGKCLHTLKAHDDRVTSVVFSNDGQRLASGSCDKTAKIWDSTLGTCLYTLEGHKEVVTSVLFSNNGQRLASGSEDGTAKIWDAISGTCLHTLEGHDDRVTSVVFSNDGRRLASGSWDKTARIWDANAGTCLQILESHHLSVTSVVFSHDGQLLALGSLDKTVKVWDVASGTCLNAFEGHGHWVTSLVFSNDGQRLASGSSDATVKIWDTTSDAWLRSLKNDDKKAASAILPDGQQRVASGSDDKTVRIWDTTSRTSLHPLESHYLSVTSVVFSNDGQRLASGSEDKTVKIWDATSGACLHTLKGHDKEVSSMSFSKDGKRLASGSDDCLAKIWDAFSGTCLHTLRGHDDRVTSVVFTNDGLRLASGSEDTTVKIWDAIFGTHLYTLDGHESVVTSVRFSNDGQRLASESWDTEVRIWDASSGTYLHTLDNQYWSVTSVVFSHDGQRLASGSEDTTIKIWDATSGTCLHTLNGHDKNVTSVVFSNGGHKLASASDDTTVKIWDAFSGTCLHTLRGHDDRVTSVVFTNDGLRLASGSDDTTIKVWDVVSGACLHTLKGHCSSVTSVVFSNNGQQLGSGSCDSMAKIWDATSGICLHTLKGHDDRVASVAFSNYGQRLASGSGDTTIKVWDVVSGACLHTLRGHCSSITSVVFSNNGQRLASGSEDKAAKVWDANSGTCLRTLNGHDKKVTSVVFSNDGHRLASGSEDTTVKIWDATSGVCLDVLLLGQISFSLDPFSYSAFSLNVAALDLDLDLATSSAIPPINQSFPLSSNLYSCSPDPDRVWIMEDGQRVLWLPPGYRLASYGESDSDSEPIAVHGSTIALGCPSGRVLIMRFRSRS
ncbi:Vegetative incompatibility protein HET-E-1 [Ceratocystis lukuohia]|uniref:Vegetative incompatibility protein HET-E-1 n=1 Tax=Ceratocystis lukuohia TaxID=2019550 RepID=A0ABR4M8R1_9PEZI